MVKIPDNSPHLCDTCKYGLKGECDITSYHDGYLSSFDQSILDSTNSVIRCTWYDSSQPRNTEPDDDTPFYQVKKRRESLEKWGRGGYI